jgi:hypothetical protein
LAGGTANVRNQWISPGIAGLALVLGLCGLPSRTSGHGSPPATPHPEKQDRYTDLHPAAVAALAGRSFEYWADRELHGPRRCETPESQFRAITPQLRGTVAFSPDGRAIVLKVVGDTSAPVSLGGQRDRRDGSIVYTSSKSFLAFRVSIVVSIDGSPASAELTFHGSGLCVTGRTRGTLRPAPPPERRGVQNTSHR